MNRKPKLENLKYHVKRRTLLKYIRLKNARFFTKSNQVRLPKDMEELEKMGVAIFLNLLKEENCKLYYDIKSSESYIKSEDETLFVFLEDRNLKIINTVFGYDIRIKPEIETYLSKKFEKELYKRRTQFKKEATAKVDYSLHKTFQKLNAKNK